MITFINYYSVFLYGFIIMIFLLNIKCSKKNVAIIFLYSVLFGIILFNIYTIHGMEFIIKSYPFIIHIPLILFFYFHFKKSFPAVLFVLCVAYVLTTPRKWLGEFVSFIFKGSSFDTLILKIIVSIILLLFVYKFLRPVVIKIIQKSGLKLIILIGIPLTYYIVAYATTVYSNILYQSNVLVVGLLATILTYILFAFLVVYFNELEKKFALQNDQNILKLQASTSETQIQQIRESQKEMSIYRHDIRHHLNLLDGYVSEGKNDEARYYIANLNNNLEKFFIKRYCENETVNSILSFYIYKAEYLNINVEMDINVPNSILVEPADICVILANGLENAIHATEEISDQEKRRIKISVYIKNSKFYIEIINPYVGEVIFENELPFTSDVNHGIGTKSIVLACNKYKGLYSFEAEDNIFTLRVILFSESSS